MANTDILLTPKFPVRHNSLLLPFLPSGLFSVPQFQREAGNKSSWKLNCHPPFSSPCFLPLYLMEGILPMCPQASKLWKMWLRLWLAVMNGRKERGSSNTSLGVYPSSRRSSCIPQRHVGHSWMSQLGSLRLGSDTATLPQC